MLLLSKDKMVIPSISDRSEMSVIELSSSLSTIKLVNSDNGEISDILLLPRNKDLRLVNLDNGEISDILLVARLSVPKLVNSDNDEISDILLLGKAKNVRLVNSDNGEISDILLSVRSKDLRLVNSDNDEISDILLLLRYKNLRLVAYSSPVRSLILEFSALREVKPSLAISASVIVSPDSLLSSSSMAARRFASGMFTCESASLAANRITKVDNKQNIMGNEMRIKGFFMLYTP